MYHILLNAFRVHTYSFIQYEQTDSRKLAALCILCQKPQKMLNQKCCSKWQNWFLYDDCDAQAIVCCSDWFVEINKALDFMYFEIQVANRFRFCFRAFVFAATENSANNAITKKAEKWHQMDHFTDRSTFHTAYQNMKLLNLMLR